MSHLLRVALPVLAVLLAMGLILGEIGRRDRVQREEAEADLAYLNYRAEVVKEKEAWDRYWRHMILRDELIGLGDNAARGGNVEQAASFDQQAEKERLNAEASKEDAEERGAAINAMEEQWRATWARYGLELAERPRP